MNGIDDGGVRGAGPVSHACWWWRLPCIKAHPRLESWFHMCCHRTALQMGVTQKRCCEFLVAGTSCVRRHCDFMCQGGGRPRAAAGLGLRSLEATFPAYTARGGNSGGLKVKKMISDKIRRP